MISLQVESLLDMGKQVVDRDWLKKCIKAQVLVSTRGHTYTPCPIAAAGAAEADSDEIPSANDTDHAEKVRVSPSGKL
jgi:hypothetical protein